LKNEFKQKNLLSILAKKYWEFGTEQFACTIKFKNPRALIASTVDYQNPRATIGAMTTSMMDHNLQNVSAQINDDN